MAKRPGQATPQSAAPDTATLHEAALAYLARYAATEASLLRTLQHRIDRWARLAQTSDGDPDALASQRAAATRAARDVVQRLAAVGAVNDAAYAESKVRSLVRAGRSRRAIGAYLSAKGVGADARHDALSHGDGDAEFAAALALARRRRIGPFRSGDPADAVVRQRELAILARAGFPRDVAQRALDVDAAEAEVLVNQHRR